MNHLLVPVALAVGLHIALSAAHSGEMKAELDLAANVKLLDTHFARYGFLPAKSLVRDELGVRFRLPAGIKEVGQTGLYSYFALAGDFEISTTFEVFALAPPTSGYGAGFGIAVDVESEGASATLARVHLPGKGSGYLVTRGVPSSGGAIRQKRDHFPTKSQSGRMVLRREKAELLCLAADRNEVDLTELCRIPFTKGTVRKVRFYADPGGSATVVDGRIGKIRLQAEEITTGLPESERNRGWNLWAIATFVLLAGALLGFARRRRWLGLP